MRAATNVARQRNIRQIGGSARDYLPGFAVLVGPVMVQRASGCPYVCIGILGVNVRICLIWR